MLHDKLPAWRLVPHLIAKDLRAVAVGTLIWILLMAIEVVLQLSGVAARPMGLRQPPLLYTLQHFLPFAEVAVVALIVSLVIHEDPLVDTQAFWLTRPIPRGHLFLAKLTALAITIFAPALAAIVVMLTWYHVPPLYMIRACFEVVLWLSFPILLLTVAAAFTSSLTRYVMLLVCALIGGLVIVGLLQTYARPPALNFEPRPPGFNDPARDVIITALLIVGFCVSLHQFYRRRDWRIALVCVALVIGAATQVGRHWPGFTFFTPIGEATGAWTDPAKTRLRLLDDRTQVNAYHPRELYVISAPVVLDGLPEGYTATPFTMAGRLTRLDGTVLTSMRAWPMQMPATGDYQPSLTMAYGTDPIDAGPTSWESWPVLLQLREGHRTALVKQGAAPGSGPSFYWGSYSGTFLYRIAHHERVARLRLDHRGAWYADGPRGITIVDAKELESECRVTLEVTNTELTFAGPREPAAGYYFVDRQTGARLKATRESTWSGMLGPLRVGLSPGRRIFTAAHVRWSVINLRDEGDDDDDAPACADTDLIFVRTTAAGLLTRSIELPDFRVQPSQDQFFGR